MPELTLPRLALPDITKLYQALPRSAIVRTSGTTLHRRYLALGVRRNACIPSIRALGNTTQRLAGTSAVCGMTCASSLPFAPAKGHACAAPCNQGNGGTASEPAPRSLRNAGLCASGTLRTANGSARHTHRNARRTFAVSPSLPHPQHRRQVNAGEVRSLKLGPLEARAFPAHALKDGISKVRVVKARAGQVREPHMRVFQIRV